MKAVRAVVACLVLGLVVMPLSAADRDRPAREWSGLIKDEALRKAAPNQVRGATGYITEARAWEKLWKAWRGNEALPRGDFAKEQVVEATVDGPNRPFLVRLPLVPDRKSDLNFSVGPTKVAGPGFGYYRAFPRQDVKTINSRPITKY